MTNCENKAFYFSKKIEITNCTCCTSTLFARLMSKNQFAIDQLKHEGSYMFERNFIFFKISKF